MGNPPPDSGPEQEGSPVATDRPAADFQQTQATDEFKELRRTHRSFVFPMAVVFLLWYFAYVLLAAYAHDFMSTKVVGNINVGLVLGLLQFVSTFAITAAYVRFANKKLDPKATAIRHELEGDPEGVRP
ncbi:DUF485 domain-containing protein [Zafaria sp. Z1313]|uniref:DUF485 domain-containing protein n=1 Tax=unclassified Zafaria TaxID=2828765 RepID=UPI002E76977D|nr:DUF485 domain-containing protein [Zafaria sp. J156]MEE1620072.1 DUF485 domain-containing protein [Zafaria sp. J156]